MSKATTGNQSAGTTDEPTTDHPRYVNGVRVPDSCRFCNSSNLTADADWTRTHPNSHNGEFTTVIACNDCGGAFITVESGNKRTTTVDDKRLVAQFWEIPEGFVMSICGDCGEIAGAHALTEDRRLLEAIHDGEITTSCCDARGKFAQDRFDAMGGERR